MGQFGPTFAANTGVRRMSDSGLYVLGALLSAAVFVLAVDLTAGSFSREVLGSGGAMVAALVSVGLLMLIDAVRLWGGRATSLGPSRQTPYAWRLRGPIGVFGWGLDTGVPVTTVRASSLPLLGVLLVATGHGGPLHGLAYGAGVAAGVLGGVVAKPRRGDVRSVMTDLQRRHRSRRPVLLTVAPAALTAGVLAAAWLSAS